MITPLQPKKFFRGMWAGEGELIPHFLLRWLLPREKISFSSEMVWLTDTIWIVEDYFEFSIRGVLERKMFAELTAPDRLHLTADDLPLGADVLLHEQGFTFAPYFLFAKNRGKVYRLRCHDECSINEKGYLHKTIRMYYRGFPVATIRLGPITLTR